MTKKRADFELFIQVVEIMKRKEHLTVEGLNQIVSIRASMNNGLTEDLKRAYPNITQCERPKVEGLKSIDPFCLLVSLRGRVVSR